VASRVIVRRRRALRAALYVCVPMPARVVLVDRVPAPDPLARVVQPDRVRLPRWIQRN
jgi:hypothetical protein